MYHPLIIQNIAEDQLRELHRQAARDRDVRLARQRSRQYRTAGARTPVVLRVLPASFRPRFT